MAESVGCTVFETALGACGVAWSEAGLTAVYLPAGLGEALSATIARRHRTSAAEPSTSVGDAIGRIQALLASGQSDLDPIRLDYGCVGDFERRVYEILREVAPGRTITYGEIARRLGDVALSRRVGQALGRNPWPIVVPCHRVLGADGKVGGFSAPGGVTTKMRLLEIERARLSDAPGLFGDLPLAIRPRA